MIKILTSQALNERTKISTDELRKKAGIKKKIPPPHLPFYAFKPEDPQRLSNAISLHKQQEKGEKQATKSIEITLNLAKLKTVKKTLNTFLFFHSVDEIL